MIAATAPAESRALAKSGPIGILPFSEAASTIGFNWSGRGPKDLKVSQFLFTVSLETGLPPVSESDSCSS